jgi:hypothetical protein
MQLQVNYVNFIEKQIIYKFQSLEILKQKLQR